MAITVERAGHALVLREPGADEQAATIAAALPEDRHRTAVVVGASAWPALARLDPWLVADLDDQVDTGVRLLAAHASSMSGGAVSLARRLADRLGVEVIAPDGDLYALTGGHTFAAGLGWVAHGAGSDRRPMGHRFPEPWWQGYLPAGHEEIPLGLWVRVPDAVTRADDPLRWIQPDPERPTVVVGAPGEPAPSAADVAEVLDAFPPDVRGRVVLACYGTDIAQAVARERGAAVRALHGLPSEHGLVHLDADGHFAWYPFAVESVYRPGCPPVLDRWVAPLPSLAMFAPARYRLAPGWSLDVLARGLLARPDTLIVDPALHTPTGPTPELLLACGPDVPDPVIATLTEVLDHLPATTKSTLRILPATPGATLAARTLAAHLVGTPRPPVAPWPEDHTQRISLDQWSIPLPRVTAGTSLLTPESLNLPEDLPTPDTPAPTTAAALLSTTPATHPQHGIDAGSAASPARRLDSGAANSSPPTATPLAAAALLSSIPTTHPQPGIHTGPPNSPSPRPVSEAAQPATPPGAHLPAAVTAPPAAATTASASLSTSPSSHPQHETNSAPADPSSPRLDSGAAQSLSPSTPPNTDAPATTTPPIAGAAAPSLSTTPATHPQPGFDAGSTDSASPRLDSGAADSPSLTTPPGADVPAATANSPIANAATSAVSAALLSTSPTTHPQPGFDAGSTHPQASRLDSGAAESAPPAGAHFPATVSTPPAAAALLSTTPTTHPQPGFDAGSAHPQAPRLDSGAAQPATPPGDHLPAAVTSSPIAASTVSSLSTTTPPDAAIQPVTSREPEQAHPSATTPTPGTSASLSTTPATHPQPGFDAGSAQPQASRLDSGAAQSSQPLPTSAAIASLASVTSASVPASTGGLPLGDATPPKKPVASLAGLVPATSAPTDAEARPLPTLVPKPAPAIPANAATPTEAAPTNTPVPADARSDEAQRRAVRSALGTRYDSATRAVVQLLAERPGLRASGDQATLLTELAVVRVFTEAPGPYDTAFHTCLTAGLRRLPTMRGVVVTGSSQPKHAEGALLRLEGPMLAVAQVGASVPGDTELLIWTTTARRLEGLLDADRRNDVVLPTHTALRVLGVEGNRLLLAEEGASAERALTNLRAAAAARAAVDVPHHPHPARWFGALPAA
ncbi:hypothetical protein [Actinokineospora globicatena]|uniref:hypothetical protein n=1 Tax=Actinokineospora globicatena TaxID=103729 RepID=UPI0025559241|nr:hypothetical protein [Actinokineospora globicatena]